MKKTCRKCLKEYPADLVHFYKNPGGKYGLTPRCKPCVNEDNKLSHAKRLEKDPVRVRFLANERAKKHYRSNLEKSRKVARDAAAKARQDPEKRANINMRKRAGGSGMSIEEYESMFEEQGRCCAICGTDDPGSKLGWNIDHCHKQKQVRFILCAHCNRGLGAFKDNPEFLRKAAEKLEEFYEPVASIYEA